MSLQVSDTEKMVADIDNAAAEIRKAYRDAGTNPMPSEESIQQQAFCAWTYMTIKGVLGQQMQAAAARAQQQRQERATRPTILVPR